MKKVFAALGAVASLLISTSGMAQATSDSVVSQTRIPPNAIDRATAVSDRRDADRAQASSLDRIEAERAARAASERQGPVAGSTLTDGVAGLGTRPDVSAPGPASPPR